ncbi:hypothetical protein PsorP6_016085 [Peronosclerospora sorghi]|uniref:Uncharacterized protein n=1 Tax=Peronosclerospora sorghi TaxID=230839 RepID=A0ACC0WNR3_9STRA|nr:hypothetical protein PsorP6_016085 [Peronosclerospora sorghi]
MNRTITERAKGMFFHMNVDKGWWSEAMKTAVFITNRLPCSAYPKKNPFELLFGQKPDISGMRVFDAKGYAHIDKSKRVKMDKKAFKCIFLGYADNVKGYCVWNIDLGRVMFTRSVTFDERPHSKYIQVRMDNVEKNHQRDDDDDSDVASQLFAAPATFDNAVQGSPTLLPAALDQLVDIPASPLVLGSTTARVYRQCSRPDLAASAEQSHGYMVVPLTS